MTINDDIKQACEVMQRGGIILYPTDTIWGIGCDATNAEAVQRVYKIKQRADSKALIVLTDSEAKVEYYVSEVPETAWQLLDVAVKPLTLIYPGARNLATNLLADDGSIAIRITKEPFSQQLCRLFRKAIVSTSANISGNAAPHNFSEISLHVLQPFRAPLIELEQEAVFINFEGFTLVGDFSHVCVLLGQFM